MARGRPRESKTDGDNGRDSQGATTGYEAELWRMAAAPLSYRYDESDSMVVCDGVKVPW